MKKSMILFCLFSQLLKGQTTFNVQSNYGYPYVFLRSVYCTDSCYYATGIMVDSANAIGTIFVKFELNGDTILTNRLISTDKQYASWFGNMLPSGDGGLIEIGLVTDTAYRGAIYKFDTNGDTLFTKEYPSPYPENEIFTPYEIVRLASNKYAILNVVEMPNLDNELLLTFHDGEFEVLSHKLYGSGMDELPGCMIPDGSGGLVIGTNRANTNTNIEFYKYRTYIFGVDSLGGVQWEYLSPQGQLQDIAHSMVRTQDGGWWWPAAGASRRTTAPAWASSVGRATSSSSTPTTS